MPGSMSDVQNGMLCLEIRMKLICVAKKIIDSQNL